MATGRYDDASGHAVARGNNRLSDTKRSPAHAGLCRQSEARCSASSRMRCCVARADGCDGRRVAHSAAQPLVERDRRRPIDEGAHTAGVEFEWIEQPVKIALTPGEAKA